MWLDRHGRWTYPFGETGVLEVLGGELVESPVVEVVLEVLEGQGVLQNVTVVSVV